MKAGELFKRTPGSFPQAPPLPRKTQALQLFTPEQDANIESYVADIKSITAVATTKALVPPADLVGQ